MRKSTVSGQLGRQPLEPLGATAPSAANPCTKEPGERPAQPNRGPQVCTVVQARRASSLNWRAFS
jgi:hypothetical protein